MLPVPNAPLPEKRKYPRVIVNIPAIYRSSVMTLDGYVANLSQGGVFLACASFDPPGTPAELMIMAPGLPQPIRVQGRVIWVCRMHPRQGMGLSFQDMPRDHRLALANFLLARFYAG